MWKVQSCHHELLVGKRPDDDDLKSGSVRINQMGATHNFKTGAKAIDTVQHELQATVTRLDKSKVVGGLDGIHNMVAGTHFTWDTVRTLKVGNVVGDACIYIYKY